MAIQNWPKTNTSGDWASVDGIVWSENQAANTVNDSARAMGRDLAKWHGDTNATLTTGGSSNAYTLTSNGSYGSLANGFCISIKANHTNTGAATLNVDSLGAKAIRKFNASGEAALSASDIVNGGHYILQYNTAVNSAAGGWVLLNPNTIVTGDIADEAVTYAKLQNISATQRVLGRNTSGAGDTEEVTATQVLDWLGSTRGQILYRGASNWAVLSPGTSGQFLKTNGAGADPSWATAGVIVDRAYDAYTSNTALTATIGYDDTIPQVSEGTQILSAAITPKVSSNRIRIRVAVNGTRMPGGALDFIIAVFVNGGSNAVAARAFNGLDNSYIYDMSLEHEYAPGSTSAQTITVRVGNSNAAGVICNGTSAGRYMGGTSACTLVLEEIAA